MTKTINFERLNSIISNFMFTIGHLLKLEVV
jgi:hypothetical protein